MRRLLLATDLSLRCDRALQRALTMAETSDVDLTILHVVDSDPDDPGHDAAVGTAYRILAEQVEAARPAAARADNVHTLVSHGRAFAEILRVAQDRQAGLVLMGYQRDEPFRELFLGSTIERVLRVGTTPTLIVKRASTRAYRRILVGVDFSPQARQAVEMARSLADEQAEIRLVHAYEVVLPALAGSLGSGPVSKYGTAFKQQARSDLNAFLSRLPSDTRLNSEVREGPPAAILEAEAGMMQANLVALGTHGRGWMQSAFLGNTTAVLVRALECDVLAVRFFSS